MDDLTFLKLFAVACFLLGYVAGWHDKGSDNK